MTERDRRDALAYFQRGAAAQKARRLDEAVGHYRAGLRLDPDHPQALSNLASALRDLERDEEALAAGRRAVELQPRSAELQLNLGHLLLHVSDWEGAAAAFEAAAHLKPGWADPLWDLSLARLRQGRLGEGWDLYERRFAANNGLVGPPMPDNRWQGEPLDGRTVAVWCEQGVGDQIRYAACVPDVAGRARRTLLVAEPRLAALFQRSFPEVTAIAGDRINAPEPRAQLLAADFHVAAGSLPRHLRRRIEDFPRHRGYLRADPERTELYRRMLDAQAPQPRVGLCWRSRLAGGRRNRFYARIEELAPILALPGLSFVNLQYDDSAAELAAARTLTANPVVALDDLDLMRDLDGAAALTAGLDLVVTVVTSVADMAGALGVPTILLAHEDYWAMHGTSAVPWYPSCRVALRRHDQSWEPAIAAAVEMVRAAVG